MKNILFYILIIILSAGVNLFAMDAQLWNAPILPGAQIAWKDKTVEVAGIRAQATRMHTDMTIEQVLDFYRGAFSASGWQEKDYFKDSNVVAFIKDNNYLYVGVSDNGKDSGRDVYLVSSLADLAICRIVAAGMDNNGMMVSDTAGKDFSDLPRYPASKRMFNISSEQEVNVAMYQAQGSPQQIAGFFRDNLKASGWKLTHTLDQNYPDFKRFIPADMKKEDAEFINLNFSKGDEELIVTVNPVDKSKKMNIVSIIRNNAGR